MSLDHPNAHALLADAVFTAESVRAAATASHLSSGARPARFRRAGRTESLLCVEAWPDGRAFSPTWPFRSWPPQVDGIRNPASMARSAWGHNPRHQHHHRPRRVRPHGRLDLTPRRPRPSSRGSDARPPAETRSSRPSTRSTPAVRGNVETPRDAGDAAHRLRARGVELSTPWCGANFAFATARCASSRTAVQCWSHDPQSRVPTGVTLTGWGLLHPWPGCG